MNANSEKYTQDLGCEDVRLETLNFYLYSS